jgi:outer membrane protein assembly factor BamA
VRRPAFLSSNNTVSVSIFTERRSEFRVYLREETGTSIVLRRETPKRRIPLSLAYRLSYGHTEATPANFCASFNACSPDEVDLLRQNSVLATLTANGVIPHVNNPLDPSRGSLTSLELTLSSRVLGSSSQFFRAIADYSRYYTIDRTLVLSWRVRGGAIFAPAPDVAGQRANFIPPEQRFYAGGANDVRGFQRNELGPVVYVVSQGEVDSATGRTADQPGRGDGVADGRQHARGQQPGAPGAVTRLYVENPAGGLHRCGRLVGAGLGELVAGDPRDAGCGAPRRDPAGAGAARRGLQSV